MPADPSSHSVQSLRVAISSNGSQSAAYESNFGAILMDGPVNTDMLGDGRKKRAIATLSVVRRITFKSNSIPLFNWRMIFRFHFQTAEIGTQIEQPRKKRGMSKAFREWNPEWRMLLPGNAVSAGDDHGVIAVCVLPLKPELLGRS